MSSAESFTPADRPEAPKDTTTRNPEETSLAQPETTKPLEDKDSNATTSSDASFATAPMATPAMPTTPKKLTPSKPAASRKPRCDFKSCNALAQRVVGDCGFCSGKFCGKHRLLESHACSGLQDCKDEAKERNKERLETERTVVVKGV